MSDVYHILHNSPVWPMQKLDGFWRMTMEYCKLYQLETLQLIFKIEYLLAVLTI